MRFTIMQGRDVFLLEHLAQTRQTTYSNFYKLLQVGVDAYHAIVISQALARLTCEHVPPNPLQRQSLLFCWEAIQQAGLLNEQEVLAL